MEKSPEAFRTISEVADWLGVPTHVLRFWESRFSQVKPVKRAGGRRYYRPSDMLLLGGIKRLLHDDGMTIRGVQKLLREEGVRHIAAFSQPLDSQYAMEDVTPQEAPGETEVPPSPMAEDVEPEPVDNVVPLETPSPMAAEAPAEDVAGADLADQSALEPAPSEGSEIETPEAETGTAPADEEVGQPENTAPAVSEPEQADSGTVQDEMPEFAFLHRPASDDAERTGVADPALASSDAAAETPEPADAPGLFSSRRGAAPASEEPPEGEAASASQAPKTAIPDTPDVPATDPTDDDPSIPRVRGIAARLRTDRLRTDAMDPAVIASAMADLRAIRARL